MKRHQNALGILEGARNLRAIARSLQEAADEAAGEGMGAEQDAAVRMIVYRLAKLCRVEEIAYGYDAVTLADTYGTLMAECRTRAKEGAAAPVPDAEPVTVLPGAEQVIVLQGAGLPELADGVPG